MPPSQITAGRALTSRQAPLVICESWLANYDDRPSTLGRSNGLFLTLPTRKSDATICCNWDSHVPSHLGVASMPLSGLCTTSSKNYSYKAKKAMLTIRGAPRRLSHCFFHCTPAKMDPTPYYGPDESAENIFIERTFVAGDFIAGLGYGVQLVLYISCALFLWNARRSRGRQSTILLGYITLLFSVETLFVAVQARTVQLMYVDNRNFPGGPWAYFLATQNLAVNVMFYATLFVLTFLSDLLVLWRCWVIWSGSGRLIGHCVVAFPALMTVGSFVMGTLWTLQSSQPGLSLYSALPLAYGTAYYVISLSVNIILTILITARLLLYRRRAVSTLSPEYGKHYFSLAAIFVESAALYSLFALIFIISYAVNNPINQIFLTSASTAQQTAGYLIIYRLAEGRAWRKETFATEDKLQTLQFMRTTLETDATTSNLETPIDVVELSRSLSDRKESGVFLQVERQTVIESLA